MWYERQVSLFLLFFFVQAVKLLHNKPLYFGGDGNSTHFIPSLVVLEFFHSDTGGTGEALFAGLPLFHPLRRRA